eukprot:577926-Pelagomonas_calceolata.AAC.10
MESYPAPSPSTTRYEQIVVTWAEREASTSQRTSQCAGASDTSQCAGAQTNQYAPINVLEHPCPGTQFLYVLHVAHAHTRDIRGCPPDLITCSA